MEYEKKRVRPKAKVAPKKDAKKAPPNAMVDDHAKKNMTKGLAEAVRKRQGHPNIKSTMPVSLDDAFKNMPERCARCPNFNASSRKRSSTYP